MKRVLFSLLFFFCLLLPLAEARGNRPNFIVFQVDDMSRSLLGVKYRAKNGKPTPLFPNLEKYFIKEGMSFTDFAASSPVCSPSRASLLSGKYPHNNRVVTNAGDLGGALGWMNSPAWKNNLVTRLQENNYHTAHFGKWLNQYGEETDSYVPPGWNTWVTDATDKSTRDFYGYYQRWKIPRLGIDTIKGPIGRSDYSYSKGVDDSKCRVQTAQVGRCNYHTDLMTRMASQEMSASKKPFYIQIDYHAPHGDHAPPAGAQAATRHLNLLKKVILPQRSINFNERDTSDKSYLTQVNNGLLRRKDIKIINNFRRHALLSLKAVDDGIGYIAGLLQKRGLLSDTYLVFLSDNGFFYGEHRFRLGKMSMYEESSKTPFMVHGPGVISGTQSNYPASTVDFLPTILALAGIGGSTFDGKSLVPALTDPSLASIRPRLIELVSEGELKYDNSWKSPIQESPLLPNRLASRPPSYRYRALQLGYYKYLAYDKGGEELYNLQLDPFEMNSLHNISYHEPLREYMEKSLNQLRGCAGENCHQIPASLFID